MIHFVYHKLIRGNYTRKKKLPLKIPHSLIKVIIAGVIEKRR